MEESTYVHAIALIFPFFPSVLRYNGEDEGNGDYGHG